MTSYTFNQDNVRSQLKKKKNSVGKDSHCLSQPRKHTRNLLFTESNLINTEGRYNGNIRLFPKRSHKPQYLEFPKGEWHDLKRAFHTDITKMVILLLT